MGGGLEGDLLTLEAPGFLFQDAEPDVTTLVDSLNCFNKIIRLEMLWTVRHCCSSGARFVFN